MEPEPQPVAARDPANGGWEYPSAELQHADWGFDDDEGWAVDPSDSERGQVP